MLAPSAIAMALLIACGSLHAQPYFIDATATSLPALRYLNGMDVESADIDGDGDLDIIIANEFQPNTILLNDGRGVFTEATGRFSSDAHDSEDIAVADFDGDGDLDVIFVSEDDFTHEYYLNDGSGHFTEVSDRLPMSIANAVVARDVTGDGFPDLFIGNDGQDFLLINDGSGKFIDGTKDRLPVDFTVTQDLELADIDGDGDLDLVAGNEDGNMVMINDGAGRFTDETSARLPIAADMETRKVTFADIDADGDLDIFFSNVAFRPGKDRQNRLYINDGRGFFTDETAGRFPIDNESTVDGKFADIDNDGDLDLMEVNFPVKPVKVFLNDGEGSFTEGSAAIFSAVPSVQGLGLEFADLNGDSLLDLYICNRGQRDRLFFRASLAPSGTPKGEKKKAELLRSSPNPFTGSTVIDYYLRRRGEVAIAIHNVTGREVAHLLMEHQEAGAHSLAWNAGSAPPGLYYCRLRSAGTTLSLPIVLAGSRF